MKTSIYIALVLTVMGSSAVANAQAEQGPFIYAMYYNCEVDLKGRADEIVATDFAPVYDAAVDDEMITGWGWLAHRTGGTWRRLHYYTAPSIGALFAAEEALTIELARSEPDPIEELWSICDTHEDYIWRQAIASGAASPDGTRGVVGLSTYFECDMAREARADEIVRSVLAPLYDARVSEGAFRSWGWNTHIVGGQYRRLGTVTADDFPTLLEARERVVSAMSENVLASEFNEICSSHTDYLWDIQVETP